MQLRWNQALRLQQGAQREVGIGVGMTSSLQIVHCTGVELCNSSKSTACVIRCCWQNDLQNCLVQS